MALSYRREIDGLRAIAVTSVVLFHAGLPLVSGGYVGVDVFFVISGFLITTILLDEASTGRLSILRFYERRARRILPALFTVILATLPFAWAWMIPEQLRDYGKSLISVMVFASNILFWRQSDYFAASAEEKPMLHTWSLAVEEQFYLFFPLAVMLLWRFGPRRFARWVALGALASLLLSDYASLRFPSANFYLLPSRAWELLVGSLCAIWLVRRDLRGDQALSFLGLGLILAPVFLYTEATPFPGRYAIAPVLGTALVLLFASKETLAGRLLGWKPMVAVGLISYSAYLWHQPLFAFARIRSIGAVDPKLMTLLVLASFGLAALTWRFVEQPFRGKAPFLPRRWQMFTASAFGSVAVLVMGGVLVVLHGLPGRFPINQAAQSYLATASNSPMRARCHVTGPNYRPPSQACQLFGLPARVAVLGNSHGVELTYALARELRQKGIGVEQQTISGCSPDLPPAEEDAYCAQWTREAVDDILADPAIKDVVVSYRITSRIEGENPGMDAAIAADMREILSELAARKHVIYVMPVPDLPSDIHKLIRYRLAMGADRIVGRSAASWASLRAPTDALLGADMQKYDRVDPTVLFCDAKTCLAGRDGVSFYFDDNHMSVDGADVVARKIVPLILQDSRLSRL